MYHPMSQNDMEYIGHTELTKEEKAKAHKEAVAAAKRLGFKITEEE